MSDDFLGLVSSIGAIAALLYFMFLLMMIRDTKQAAEKTARAAERIARWADYLGQKSSGGGGG